MAPNATRYDQDVYTWALETAERLRQQKWDTIDWDAVIEEIEAVGISQQHAVQSRLMQLLLHLLKWVAQSERRQPGRSWATSITNQRLHLERLFDTSPSLRRHLSGWLGAEYGRAVRGALRQTGLSREAFPATCPWTADQVLDDDFWPEHWDDHQ